MMECKGKDKVIVDTYIYMYLYNMIECKGKDKVIVDTYIYIEIAKFFFSRREITL